MIVQDIPETALAEVVSAGADATALSAIHHPDIALAIWKRAPLGSFQSWINSLPPDQLPIMRTVLQPSAVHKAVVVASEQAGTTACAQRDRLAGDIAALAEAFCGLMAVSYVRVRLEAVHHDACTKFHHDRVHARLICTYRGPGTQYGIARADGDPCPVEELPTSVPAIFKGALASHSEDARFLHRSPPIKGTGMTRLVLVLDPIADFGEG